MQITPTALPDVLLLTPRVFADERGYFMETYNKADFHKAGITCEFVQDNQSKSRKGVLRGLHFQKQFRQAKLVRVTKGEVYDVAVDLRPDSATFRQWIGEELCGDERCSLWIPEGFAHGFLVLSESADVLYKTTDFYSPEHERCIRWNDPAIGIDWPLYGDPVLSAKDAKGAAFSASLGL